MNSDVLRGLDSYQEEVMLK